MALPAATGPEQFTSWIIHRGLHTPASDIHVGAHATLPSCCHPAGEVPDCRETGPCPPLDTGLSCSPSCLPCLLCWHWLAESPPGLAEAKPLQDQVHSPPPFSCLERVWNSSDFSSVPLSPQEAYLPSFELLGRMWGAAVTQTHECILPANK